MNISIPSSSMATTLSPPYLSHKRSAHLQIKKAKTLGIDIASLIDQDILFINSLTIGDSAKLEAKCRV